MRPIEWWTYAKYLAEVGDKEKKKGEEIIISEWSPINYREESRWAEFLQRSRIDWLNWKFAEAYSEVELLTPCERVNQRVTREKKLREDLRSMKGNNRVWGSQKAKWQSLSGTIAHSWSLWETVREGTRNREENWYR